MYLSYLDAIILGTGFKAQDPMPRGAIFGLTRDTGIAEIVAAEREVMADGLPIDAAGMRRLKAMGFSDKRLAYLALRSAHVRKGMGRAAARGSASKRR